VKKYVINRVGPRGISLMKRFSQTVKVVLALFVAVFANGTLPTMTAYAAQAPETEVVSQTDSSPEISPTPVAEQEGVVNDGPTLTGETVTQPVTQLALVSQPGPEMEQQTHPVPACKTSDIYIVSKNANLTEVKVVLTNDAAKQNKTCIVSLNSYETDGPTWETSGTQKFIEHDQVILTGHEQETLKVKAPKCFGQTDLYLGSTKYDGEDGPLPHFKNPTVVVPTNLIKYWNGGEKCPVPTIKPCRTITDQPLVTNDSYANYSGFGIVGGQDTRSNGHYKFATDGVHIWTDGNSDIDPITGKNGDKVAWYHSVNYDLNAVGEPAMNYTVSSGGVTPGLQLVIDFNNDGTPDGILVGESVYGNDWWTPDSSAAFVKTGAPLHTGGYGSSNHGTLNQWLAAFPTAKVKAVGFSLGSGVYASGVLHSLTFGCVKWTFGLKEVTAQAPKFTDRCGVESDTVWIPSTEGVIYKINGEVATSGYHSVSTGWVTVTAEAKDGYSLKGENNKWTKCFTNSEDCVTVTKEALPVTDTNNDGTIGLGDVVTWNITVTNNSENDLDNFRIELTDNSATIIDNAYVTNGVIKYLKHGASVTVTATSTLTVDDVKACRATNTVEFQGWYTHKHHELDKNGREDNSSFSMKDDSYSLEGSSNTAIAEFTCPTPGSGDGETPTPTPPTTTTTSEELPAVLPSTGPSNAGSPIVILAAAAIAYGATYFLQRRRETSEI